MLLYPTRGNERPFGARAIARPTIFQSRRFLFPLWWKRRSSKPLHSNDHDEVSNNSSQSPQSSIFEKNWIWSLRKPIFGYQIWFVLCCFQYKHIRDTWLLDLGQVAKEWANALISLLRIHKWPKILGLRPGCCCRFMIKQITHSIWISYTQIIYLMTTFATERYLSTSKDTQTYSNLKHQGSNVCFPLTISLNKSIGIN